MLKRIALIAVFTGLFVSCHNKLEILAPYKESVAVYGLLDPNDTAQYIRIERVYLGEGNALTMAQNQDSIYFKPGDLKVTLQRFKGGNRVSVDNPYSSNMEIVLSETYIQTQTGVFNPNQLLYKTNHAIYEDSQYQLVIHSNKTGKEFTSSKVSLIGDFKSHFIYSSYPDYSVINTNPSPISIVPSANGTVNCKFASPVNANVCGIIMRFFYTEYPGAGPIVSKYVDFDLGHEYLSGVNGGETVELSFLGDAMIQNIARAIKVDPTLSHRTADSVQFRVNGGGYDISLYNQVNSTGTLSQSKPTYTNIDGGVGVFSCRKEYILTKKINTQQCLDRLASDDVTCKLLFYGWGGSTLPCQ
jgi:hypothetical protein